MNNYLMFDRLLKCSVVPKVGTKRSFCGEKYSISLLAQERTSKAIFRGKVKEQKPPGKMAM